MTKLPQPSKMGVGVTEVVEMFATSICDTEPVVIKGSVESSSSQHGVKRHFSELSPDSPQPQSPGTPEAARRPKKKRIASRPSPDQDTDTDEEEIAKRVCLECPASSDTDCETTSSIRGSYASRRRRFLRTAQVLRQSGLLNITMKTAELLRKNQVLQREIENLQRETRTFVLSVLSNPENRHILDNIRSGAQLYEVVVPGSQRIMSVSTHPTDVNMNSASSTLSDDMSNDSISSHSNMSSPSPPPTVSSSSDDASSLSDDIESSEEENLSPPKSVFNSEH
ncbi:CLOCK-interacting pacemaker-like [Homarus americanus]|uniref:CLOCK-interacting pacemaker-like n=1 Tax=Homarus americanus TaxID=6706 RepID=UPI001C444CF2|nr:CLOCK-interacting pacemaker-like [Homarus americanus]